MANTADIYHNMMLAAETAEQRAKRETAEWREKHQAEEQIQGAIDAWRLHPMTVDLVKDLHSRVLGERVDACNALIQRDDIKKDRCLLSSMILESVISKIVTGKFKD